MSVTAGPTSQRLSEVFAEARQRPISFDDNSRIIFFSDCHRGDNGWGDNFAPNQNLFFHALKYYFQQEYTYIEVGDGDELWHHPDFGNIRRAHDHVYWLMREFHKLGRLHMIWGNHDIERSDPSVVEKDLYTYYDDRAGLEKPLLDGIKVHEGLILKHALTGHEVFVVHGHQGSKVNDQKWRLGRFAVRYGWSRLQAFGIKDPTRVSQDPNKQHQVESLIKQWITANNNQVTICGHTHRTEYPVVGSPPYFNTGCCVHPRFITGIELNEGKITLVKWWLAPDDVARERGPLYVTRDVIRGPEELQQFFGTTISTREVEAPSP